MSAIREALSEVKEKGSLKPHVEGNLRTEGRRRAYSRLLADTVGLNNHTVVEVQETRGR